MCGRFAQPRSPDELARIFRATAVSDLPGDRFNVAPTDPVAAVVEHHGERVVDTFRWGLVPFFAEGPKSRSPLINARAETVETAPAFRTSFARRRCIVPAEAFYEWRRHRDPETNRIVRSEPFAIRRRTGEPLAFAGVWAIWRNRETAERLYSLAIVTGPPNGLVATVHDRMPIVLDPGDWDTWLDEGAKLAELRPLLRPYPAGELLLYPVSPGSQQRAQQRRRAAAAAHALGRRRVIIALPPDALVLLVGPSGAGKSTFAARHFAPTEVLSSDAMRAMVADDPMDQAATDAAFELLHTAAGHAPVAAPPGGGRRHQRRGLGARHAALDRAPRAAAGPCHRLRPPAGGLPAPQPGA